MPDRITVEKNKKEFPPGSKKARQHGCTCDPEMNKHGKGYNNKNYMWLVSSTCKLHWFEVKLLKKRKKK